MPVRFSRLDRPSIRKLLPGQRITEHGITADADYAPAFAELGYWPPQKGPRVKGFEQDAPKLIALPTIGDLQTLTYRNDVFANIGVLAAAFLVSVVLSMALLERAARDIPMGTAYAVWTGIGAVGAALYGIVYFGEPRGEGRAGHDAFDARLLRLAREVFLDVREEADERDGATVYVALRTVWDGHVAALAPAMLYDMEEIDPAVPRADVAERRPDAPARRLATGERVGR